MAAEDFGLDQAKIKLAATEVANGECHIIKEYFDSLSSVNAGSEMLREVEAANKTQRENADGKYIDTVIVNKGVSTDFLLGGSYVYMNVRNLHNDVFSARYSVDSNTTESKCAHER